MDSTPILGLTNNPFYDDLKKAWTVGPGPKEYGLYLANKRKKYTPRQTNKKKNFKK